MKDGDIVRDDKGRPAGIFRLDKATHVPFVDLIPSPPKPSIPKKQMDEAKAKLDSLNKPCKCGNEMKFEHFTCRKAKSISMSGQEREVFVGKYQCTKCKERFFVTAEEIGLK